MQKLLHIRIYRLFLFREGLPFYIWFYPHMMDYDVALHNLEGLFVVIPTSPRTSKTESGWKTCCVLGVGNITGPPRDKVHTSHVWYLLYICRKALVATFPTSLVSSRLELPCKSYCISGFAVLCCFSCPEYPASGVLRAGVSGLPGFGAKSPADGACAIGSGVGLEYPRSLRLCRSLRPS